MPLFLDPRGRSTYGIGLCGRCSRKMFLDQLYPDPNSPGLMVCKEDLDQLDPYRLPARQTERITLPFNRPDLSLTDDQIFPAPILSGIRVGNVINLSWVQPPTQKYLVSAYDIFRQTDTGAFLFLAEVPATKVLAYSDTTVISGVSYAYYVEAVASIAGSPKEFSSPSNTISFLVSLLITDSGSFIVTQGGAGIVVQ